MKLSFFCGILMACTALAGTPAQKLTGAGATFPNPIYSRWFTEYNRLHPGVEINYQSIGSGAGIRQVSERVIDFGATDSPMTDEQLAEAKVRLLHIPTLLGAVVPVYNLPGEKSELHFAPEVLADIYLGKITRWNDPRLARDNPQARLPDRPILPVYRSDGAGTTYIFTDFLCKVSPSFAARVGRNASVRWPRGIGQKGSEGIAGIVRDSPYSLGYVELVYATENHLTFGLVRNPAGRWVRASAESVMAAAEGSEVSPDFRNSLTNALSPAAYPIASFTWLLIPVRASDPARGRAFADFLRWMLHDGVREAEPMAYVPLPPVIAERVREAIEQLR